jgi:hypothetical protein
MFNFLRAQVFSFLEFILRLPHFLVLIGAWEMQVQIWNFKYAKIR